MLSRTSQYALTTLGYLAGEGGRRTGEEIARQTGIPANYLSKILNQLRKHAIVAAEKGWGGGFELRPESLDSPILDVVTLLEGPAHAEPVPCVFGLANCDASQPCPLHGYWERIKQIHDDMLRRTRIRDLATVRRRRAPAPARRSRRERSAS
jgi:Rrf2 family protein